jgi:hypothetical protein
MVLAACGGGDDSTSASGGSGAATAGSDKAGSIGSVTAGATGHAGSNAAGTSAADGGQGGRAGTAAVGGGGSSTSGVGGASSAGSSAAHGGGTGGSAGTTIHFSFFVTSYAAIQRLAGTPNGFGGDLRFGKADGLSGADEICRQIADYALPGAGQKTWHAFLSVTKGPQGVAVNAIDRVGDGPWYDRLGRLVAANKTDLANDRPKGADAAIINDLPNEDGVPNHAPDGSNQVDNHDILTGSSTTGTLYSTNSSSTCHDWTSAVGGDGKPRCGHSWPRDGGGSTGNGHGGNAGGGSSMSSWMSSLDEAGCAAGASLIEMGPPDASNPTVGSGGGYGGFYCFALTP